MVLCEDKTVVDSLEGLLRELLLRQAGKDERTSSSHDPQMVATPSVVNVAQCRADMTV